MFARVSKLLGSKNIYQALAQRSLGIARSATNATEHTRAKNRCGFLLIELNDLIERNIKRDGERPNCPCRCPSYQIESVAELNTKFLLNLPKESSLKPRTPPPERLRILNGPGTQVWLLWRIA